jgi:hypothetical protein
MVNLLHIFHTSARPRRARFREAVESARSSSFSTSGFSLFGRGSFRPHPQRLRTCAIALPTALTLALSACGGSADKTVASIDGHSQVTQAMLDHWMVVVLGGDYDAARIVPKVAGRPKLNHAQLQLKCHQLDVGIKEQALGYVLSVLWTREEAKEMGLHLPNAGEISAKIGALIHAQFKDPQNFRKIISEQHRSLADVRFLIKRNILQDEITPKLKAKAHGDERAYLKLVLQSNASWQRRTSCAAGYQAWECRQYSGKEAKPPPAVVLEYLKKGVA